MRRRVLLVLDGVRPDRARAVLDLGSSSAWGPGSEVHHARKTVRPVGRVSRAAAAGRRADLRGGDTNAARQRDAGERHELELRPVARRVQGHGQTGQRARVRAREPSRLDQTFSLRNRHHCPRSMYTYRYPKTNAETPAQSATSFPKA